MKGMSVKGRKNQMLKQVQHDNGVWLSFLSSRTCFGISVLGLKNLGFKAPCCRRGTLLFLFCGVLLVFSFQNGIASKESRPGDSIIFAGLERTYRIHMPPTYDKSNAVPLLIALHGGRGSGEKMEELTLRGFNRLSDKEGFIVVYPDGIEKHWNDGRENVKYRAHREKIDDVGFISALIDHLAKQCNIDINRVYATGISNGAMMSFRLGCELSEKIAAIAPVAGSMPENLPGRCLFSRVLPVLMISNTDDQLVPWEGGEIRFGRQRFGKVSSVAESVKFWTTHNQCSSAPNITWEPDRDPKDGTRVRKELYNQCRESSEVVLYGIEGGGHTWPGGHQYLPEWIIGKTSRDIDANEVIWSIFKKHARE
jgi:polyhydroxybutyrate depolymerase